MSQPAAERPHADTDPGRGRRMGFDVGTVRIGVSLSDPDGILATPLETISAEVDGSDVQRAVELIEENFVVEVVVGLPVALRGNFTQSTSNAVNFAADLREELPNIPVRMVDERMSTMAASQAFRASGLSTKKGRGKIDQAAAVHILQGWLDARRQVLY
ncbi:MAG TPA: Holliday junction resolvase RuvX [Candidatus Corynebacterium gallistercoris]|uniref:Putative pre-16S rRNA nuclease n=1 Tax=Candidatus Corynebacterium gallistercoris TaxID=2838530 RepID=A0A9D1RZI4_9CORY|nr:Holliday junction resolvase RuvX [Candidatus Corynebacterium gallistercoris]